MTIATEITRQARLRVSIRVKGSIPAFVEGVCADDQDPIYLHECTAEVHLVDRHGCATGKPCAVFGYDFEIERPRIAQLDLIEFYQAHGCADLVDKLHSIYGGRNLNEIAQNLAAEYQSEYSKFMCVDVNENGVKIYHDVYDVDF